MVESITEMRNTLQIQALEIAQKAFNVLVAFDRLPNNPDVEGLRKSLENQMLKDGKIEISIFVCPSYKPAALFGPNPEEYVEIAAKNGDLFLPRVPKILDIKEKFQYIGIPLTFTLLIGDDDPQNYVLPCLSDCGVMVDNQKLSQRQALYKKSFEDRAKKLLGNTIDVVSLQELDYQCYPSPLDIPQDIQAPEERFLKRLFSKDGPYKGMFPLKASDITQMARLKIISNSRQGFIIQNLTGGILLQTETPWLLRTGMLKLAGANIAIVYPWIRKEEIESS